MVRVPVDAVINVHSNNSTARHTHTHTQPSMNYGQHKNIKASPFEQKERERERGIKKKQQQHSDGTLNAHHFSCFSRICGCLVSVSAMCVCVWTKQRNTQNVRSRKKTQMKPNDAQINNTEQKRNRKPFLSTTITSWWVCVCGFPKEIQNCYNAKAIAHRFGLVRGEHKMLKDDDDEKEEEKVKKPQFENSMEFIAS